MIPICRGKMKLDPVKWIFGCLVFDPDDMEPVGIIQQSEVGHPLDIPYMCDGCVDGNLPGVIKETIGMYTGVDDAAGMQIYEGDIVEPRLVIGPHAGYGFGKKKVEFRRGAFVLVDYMGREFVTLNGLDSAVELRVCGNVHDNPELMEARNESGCKIGS